MNISNQNLDIDPAGAGSMTVRVTYQVSFSPFERRLAGQGLRYREEIIVQENDFGEIIIPPGADPSDYTPDTLAVFPIQPIPVTDGNSVQIIQRNRTISVATADLDEDPATLNPDEIRCRIRIRPLGFPRLTTAFTDTEEVNI